MEQFMDGYRAGQDHVLYVAAYLMGFTFPLLICSFILRVLLNSPKAMAVVDWFFPAAKE